MCDNCFRLIVVFAYFNYTKKEVLTPYFSEPLKAQHLITKYYPKWKSIKDTKDNGNFCTTPFFISFIDDAKKLRLSQCLYLTSLCENEMGLDEEAIKDIRKSAELNNDNIFAMFFSKYGFLD